MTALITSDIHLTDNPRDEYRWKLLPWLSDQCAKYHVNTLLILGDLTNVKDRHSAVLINRFVDQLCNILDANERLKIVILKGNHDYIDPKWPFFRFIEHLGDLEYITKPEQLYLNLHNSLNKGVPCLLLPETKDYEKEWSHFDFTKYQYIFTHATYEGILADNGFPIPGIPTSIFGETKAKIYSGDIHAPQKIGPVEYIGSPYRTHFGDIYNPRVVLINDDAKPTDLIFPCPGKHLVTIRILKDLDSYKEIKPGDQVKIRIKLKRSEYPSWKSFREEVQNKASEKKWNVFSIELAELVAGRQRLEPQSPVGLYRSPEQIIRDYSDSKRLEPEQLATGLALLQG